MKEKEMTDNNQSQHVPVPLGYIEPHVALLGSLPEGKILYKIMSTENLLRSVSGGYLHFNRVDCYADFPGADPKDGRQLPQDEPGNASSRFQHVPQFTAADYYEQARARTYACCFSSENSGYIWSKYANNSKRGKVCVEFNLGRLRNTINNTLQSENSAFDDNGNRYHQIFSVNYGLVEYVEWNSHKINTERLPNPILYAYLKDKHFAEEREIRVSLSAIGIGKYILRDGSEMKFPKSLKLTFDFQTAIEEGAIVRILCAPDTDTDFLKSELHKLHIALENEV